MFLVVTFIHNTDETFERFTIIKTLVKCIRLKKILLQIQTNLHNFTYNICRKNGVSVFAKSPFSFSRKTSEWIMHHLLSVAADFQAI